MSEKKFTVGELANIAGVSARTVRYYHKKGLLQPVDYSETGYRFYNENSMAQLQKILMLKFLGFSLEKIKNVIGKDKEQFNNLKESLAEQKKLLMEKQEHLNRVINAVENAEKSNDFQVWENLVNIIKITEEREKVINQYRTDINLQKRINIHDFSTSKISWSSWVFERFNIHSGMKILEIGCGNSVFWKNTLERLPRDLDIYLTDYSLGMLEKSKKTIEDNKKISETKNIKFHFAKKDANDFYTNEGDYDLIIANHMLYYVENKSKLFENIKQLLADDGKFCCTTVGDNHMIELRNFVKKFDKNIEIPKIDFTLENGKEQLNTFFSDIILYKHENNLVVNDTDVIYNYVYSYSEKAAEVLECKKKEFYSKASQLTDKDDGMFIHKSTGMFVCCKK